MQPDQSQPDPIARVIEQYAIENANLRITVSQLQAQVEQLRGELAAQKEGGGES